MPAVHIRDHCHSAADVWRAAKLAGQKRDEDHRRSTVTLVDVSETVPTPDISPDIISDDMPYEVTASIGLRVEPWRVSFLEMVAAAYPEKYPTVIITEDMSVRPRIDEIKRAVCRHYKISITDINSGRRDCLVITPRHLAQALTHHLTLLSMPTIARLFGGRDHTTILHACRKMEPIIRATAEKLGSGASLGQWVREAAEQAEKVKPQPRIRRQKPSIPVIPLQEIDNG